MTYMFITWLEWTWLYFNLMDKISPSKNQKDPADFSYSNIKACKMNMAKREFKKWLCFWKD